MGHIDERHAAAQSGTGAQRAWLGLGVLTLPVLLVSLDVSVLFLAMPRLTASMGPSATQQLWILDIYGFLIAGLLITMGNFGDRFGRRRLLLAGATLFGAASVIAAFAPGPEVLIGARALMGIGGATLLPSSLSLISNMFDDQRARAKAIGVWTAMFAGGAALGPIIGGLLLHHFWWGSVFLINVPVLLVLLALGPALLPEHRSAVREPVDVPSVVLSIGGILPVVYAIKHAASEGLDWQVAGFGLAGLLILGVFASRQRRLTAPLLDLGMFKNGLFSAAIGSSLVGMMSLAAMSYLTSIYLQSVAGRDVLTAAIFGIPMTVSVFVFSMAAPSVARRVGVRATFVLALVLAAVGNLLLLGVAVDAGLPAYLVGSTVAGIGYGLSFTMVSDVAISSVPPERAGAATGISETSFELGNALGLALLGSIAMTVFHAGGRYNDTLDETLRSSASDGALIAAARGSFVDGMHVAASVSGATLLAVAVVVAAVLRPKSDAPPEATTRDPNRPTRNRNRTTRDPRRTTRGR